MDARAAGYQHGRRGLDVPTGVTLGAPRAQSLRGAGIMYQNVGGPHRPPRHIGSPGRLPAAGPPGARPRGRTRGRPLQHHPLGACGTDVLGHPGPRRPGQHSPLGDPPHPGWGYTVRLRPRGIPVRARILGGGVHHGDPPGGSRPAGRQHGEGAVPGPGGQHIPTRRGLSGPGHHGSVSPTGAGADIYNRITTRIHPTIDGLGGHGDRVRLRRALPPEASTPFVGRPRRRASSPVAWEPVALGDISGLFSVPRRGPDHHAGRRGDPVPTGHHQPAPHRVR